MIKIKPSARNTNKHTPQGMELLEKSIDKVGVIESISVADDGTIISGHARKEIFDKKGMKPKEIELKNDEYAVIKTDIKANSKEYYEAQILANTSAHKNFNLDTELIEVIAEEFDIDVVEVGVEIYNTDNIDLDKFFEENNEQKEQKNKITLEYTEEDYQLVIDAFSKHSESKEQIVFKLLGL